MLIESLTGIIFALYLSFSIGANDETLATLAGSGSLSLSSAIIFGATFSLLGAVLLGYRVEGTIGKEIINGSLTGNETIFALASVAFFLTLLSVYGLPVSTTHASVGVLIGLGIAKYGFSGVSTPIVIRILIGWILSPLIGFYGTYSLNKIFNRLRKRYIGGLLDEFKTSRMAAISLFFWVGLSEFSRGANDIGNITGFLFSMDIADPFTVRIIAGCGLFFGLLIIGRRVVKKVGLGLVRVAPVSGLAAQVVIALILFGSTVLGLPISGSHVLVGALLGIGLSEGTFINIKNLEDMVLAWLVTFFGTFLIGYLGYYFV